MRLKCLRLFVALSCLFAISGTLPAQNCVPTNINGATINLACNQVCTTISFPIPHLKSSSDYTLVTVPYVPYPYNTPTGSEYTPLYADDQYSNLIPLPFTFCFYDSLFNNVVVGSNGLMTFDAANAGCANSWPITTTIPFAGGTICSAGSTYYPKAAIMGAYSDLDPRIAGTTPLPSPPERKIQWEVTGTAPCRKFVVSYYHVGVFGSGCGLTTPNTLQMVIHESTGIIEVFIEQKACLSTTNAGRAILGIQNWSRNMAIAAPGKNNTAWSENNTGYRFIPSAGGSRYVVSEMYTMGGSLIRTADTATTTAGILDLSFPNICPPGGTTQYVVKTTFSSCSNPVDQLISFDTITVNRTNSLNATGTTTNTSCGPPSGTIAITMPAGVGTPPYSYVLDGGIPQVTAATNYTFNNVSMGPHTVVVTDASLGCTSTVNVTVNLTTVLSISTSTAATSCPGVNDGGVTVTTVNGTGPYSFSLDGGAPQFGPIPFTFNNVPAGNHTVRVVDLSNGCLTTPIPVTVGTGPAINTTVSKTDVLCNGGNTGTITVTQPAGVPPFQYSLNGVTWQPSNVFNGLTAGTYNVFYQAGSGCQGSQSITISQPSALSSAQSAIAAVCNGQNNGVITVTPAGGTGPYQYSIDGGVSWQPGNAFNVGAGNYNVTIRDNNNCTLTQPVTISQPAILSASASTTAASCNGGPDGSITVTASGGNSSYQYSTNGTTYQASNVFNVLAGNYTVTVKDNLGCTTTVNATVGLTSNLAFTPMTDVTICEGTSTALQLISNANVYSWSPSSSLNNSAVFNPVANPTTTTQYYVTATLGSCSLNDTVIVNVNPAPIPNAGSDGAICYGQIFQLQGSGGTSFSWAPSTYLNSTNIPDPVSIPDRTITYTLSVIDANGCSSLVSDDVVVDVTQPIHVTTLPYDTIGYPGDQFQLSAIAIATSFVWSPATGLDNPNIANPIVTVQDIGGDMLYRVTASTAAGCKGEGFVRLRVYTGPDLYVPTGFTPNQDGLNDTFFPFPVGIQKLNYFRVYNRWGQLIYFTSTLSQGWDGKYAGKDQASGAYVWMVQGVTKDGRIITKKGTIMLIR
ncbi:MAG TPA: gliding motility-associated C-terminal domain-containing protein [Chitinophagaceae bacterium]|nr:gliding motility-associated C-terminal domain-containing protein [Chitinophagaceae bacterium]